MPKKKILMLVGDYVEDYEVMVPFQMLLMCGHDVHAVCPGKKAGDVVVTAVHDFEGQQTYSEKRGHNFRVTSDFDAINVRAYDGLVIPGGRSPEYLRMVEKVREIVRYFHDAKLPIAAICHGAQLLAAAGVLKGHKISAYPACQAEVEMCGGTYVPTAETFDNAHTHEHFVTAPAWPAHPNWMRQYLELLGTKITT